MSSARARGFLFSGGHDMNTPFVDKLIRAWNSHDAAAIAALYAADARVQHPFSPAPLVGREAVRQLESGLFAAFDQIEWSVIRALQQGADHALEFRVVARHCAPLPTPKGPVPATHKRIDVCGVSLFKLGASGEIAEEHRYFDIAAMMGQLGLG
jgi:steroid delta-isomerase-like uncharacterized protein